MNTSAIRKQLAGEINAIAPLFDEVLEVLPGNKVSGDLLALIDAPHKSVVTNLDDFDAHLLPRHHKRLVILHNALNHSLELGPLLCRLSSQLSHGSRLLLVAYSPYLNWAYRLTSSLNLRDMEVPTNFVTRADLRSLARLAKLEVVRERPASFIPFFPFYFLDRVLSALPLVRRFALAELFLLRPMAVPLSKPSVSIIVPARNERGNIRPLLERLPAPLSGNDEVIFIEGNSTDGTFDEIQAAVAAYNGSYQVSILKQPGKGKNDAVRFGIRSASKDVIVILDADLSTPPESLPTFYEALITGAADFINGSRLVYAMEKGAMPFTNVLANTFFAKLLSFVLDVKIGDALCGTKLFLRSDYERIEKWRDKFGDHDPFGDFDLLFAAAQLGLGIVDVPIHYRRRVYGTSNIQHVREGLKLLKMACIGLLKVRMSAKPANTRG